jgi:chaperonin GroES
MNLKPLGDKVVVRRLEDEEQKTSGGIYIPDTAKEKPTRGEVVAAGPGKMKKDGSGRAPMQVKAGDRILFGKYSGTEVKLGNETLLMMDEDDILGVLETGSKGGKK